MSGAFDLGSCGFFSRGGRAFRGATDWPGWNAGASGCRLDDAWKLASEASSFSVVSWPPNWRPPAAVRCGNLGAAAPRPPLPLPRCPPLEAITVDGTSCACAGGAEGLSASLWPPRPRPRPLRPPLCDSAGGCPSSRCSAGVLGFRRGRRLLWEPREASPGAATAGGAVVVDMVRASVGGGPALELILVA
jgi:hypothetical protein